MLCLLLGSCSAERPLPGRAVAVERQDLVLAVEVSGTLKALDAVEIGPPPGGADIWDFKIIRMAQEGTTLKAGAEAVAFDTSELDRKLQDHESEVARLTQELGQMRGEHEVAALTQQQALTEAQAKQRKADLKADKPADLNAELLSRVAGIERDLAQGEARYQAEKQRAGRQLNQAEEAVLQSRLDRAQGRVAESKALIAAMAVKAPRGGMVVYKQNWRGEKRKVGDGIWRGDTVLEIASLERMAAQGQVDEVDASHVAVGQRVGLRLEAHPEREYRGEVRRVANLVQTESPESRVKIVQLDISLSEADPLLMRPGMRLRGKIEIARVAGVLQVPLAAIEATAAGPVATRVGTGGRQQVVPLRLGRRGRDAVEVLAGLAPGDKVLLRALGEGADKSPRLGGS